MKDFCIEFCLSDSEYMTALRLAVGGVCAAADTDLDSAEDMKVCITECCLILKSNGFEKVKVTMGISGGLHAIVEGEGGKPVSADDGFSLMLVSALVTDCALERVNGAISKLILKL